MNGTELQKKDIPASGKLASVNITFKPVSVVPASVDFKDTASVLRILSHKSFPESVIFLDELKRYSIISPDTELECMKILAKAFNNSCKSNKKYEVI